jgi:hypothetical protein
VSLPEIIALAAVLIVLVLLDRAANVLGRDGYRQIGEHEDLAGRFPPPGSMAEKLAAIDRHDVSPPRPQRLWLLVAAVVVFLALSAA